MKFSIVTISFNQSRFLEQAIESVLGQEGVDLEYIVVDPGSTDGSREIIERYRDRLAHVGYERDAGPADGLNRGFARATGDVFYFLNADDEAVPGAFAAAAGIFKTRPDIDVVLGGGKVIDARGKVLETILPTRFTPWLYLNGAVTLFQQGAFFRRSAFEAAGGFNAANHTCWDGELLLAMAMSSACFETTRAHFGRFRIHEQSISGSGRLNERFEADSERMRAQHLGPRPHWRSRLEMVAARTWKLLSNPGTTVLNAVGRRTPA